MSKWIVHTGNECPVVPERQVTVCVTGQLETASGPAKCFNWGEHPKCRVILYQVEYSVKRTERGWGAHFAGVAKCYFRRNTLLECGERRVVVSTVGNYHGTWQPLGSGQGNYRTYETMAFEAVQEGIYWDAAVDKPFEFEGVSVLPRGSNDLEANNMHENAVEVIAKQLEPS